MGSGRLGRCVWPRLAVVFVLATMEVVAGEKHAPYDTANVTYDIIRTLTSDDGKAEVNRGDGGGGISQQHRPHAALSSKIEQPAFGSSGRVSVKSGAARQNPRDSPLPSSTASKPKEDTSSSPATKNSTSTILTTGTGASSENTHVSTPKPSSPSSLSSSSSSPVNFLSDLTSSSSFLTSSSTFTKSHKHSQVTPTVTYPSRYPTKNVEVVVVVSDKTTTGKATGLKTSFMAINSSPITTTTTTENLRTKRSSDQGVTPSTVTPTTSETALPTSPKTTDHVVQIEEDASSTVVQSNKATMSTMRHIPTNKRDESTTGGTMPNEDGKSTTTPKASSSSKTALTTNEPLSSSTQRQTQPSKTPTSLGSTQMQHIDVTTPKVTETSTQETSLQSTSLRNTVTQTATVTSPPVTFASSEEPWTLTSTKHTTGATTGKSTKMTYTSTEGNTGKSTDAPTNRNTDMTTEETSSTTTSPSTTTPSSTMTSSSTMASSSSTMTPSSTMTSSTENVITSSTVPSTTTDCMEVIRMDGLRIVESVGQTAVTLTWRSLTSVSRVMVEFDVRVKRRKGDDSCVEYTVENESEFKPADSDKQPQKIEACKQTQEKLIPVNGTVVIRDLKICTEYDVTVTSKCGTCTCVESDTASVPFTTASSEPGRVRSVLAALNLTESSRAQVSWLPPVYPTCGITHYILRLSSKDGTCTREIRLLGKDNDDDDGDEVDKEADSEEEGSEDSGCKGTAHGSFTSPTFVFRNLLPDSDYTVNVTAVNDVGSGPPVSTFLHTMVVVPTAPTQLDVRQVTSHSLTLKWEPPSPRPGATNYTVEVMDMDSPYYPVLSPLNTASVHCATGYEASSCRVDSLRAYWRYNLTLTASTVKGHSPPAGLGHLITTESTAPGAVTSLDVERADDNVTAVRVTWDCPALTERNARITGFLVRSWILLVKEHTNQTDGVKYVPTEDCDVTHVVDFSVIPENQYFFQVLTLADGINATQWTTVAHFAPTGVSQAVSSVTVTGVGASNVTLQWSRPAVTNGHLTDYGVKVTRTRITDGDTQSSCIGWTVVTLEKRVYSAEIRTTGSRAPGAFCPQHDPVTVDPGNQSVSLTLGDLPPDTSLILVVYPRNEAGWGLSANVSVRTEEAAPTAPTHISVNTTNATTLVVRWTPPEPRPGATNYSVILYRDTKLSSSNYTFPESTTINVTGWSSHMAVAPDLWSGGRYTLTLVTTTSKGSRTVQYSRKINMPESPPGRVRKMSVHAVANDYRHVQITWDYPALMDRHGVIVNFTVCCQRIGSRSDQCQTIEQSCQQRSPQFGATCDVTPGHNYTLMVVANNEYSGLPVANTFSAKIGPPPSTFGVPSTSSITTGNSQSSFRVTFCAPCLLNDTNGEITLIALLVCLDPICQQVNMAKLHSPAYIDSLPSWKTAKGDNFQTLYRPTDVAWITAVRTLLGGARRAANSSAEGVYTVGEDTDCQSRDVGVYCNGPLPAGMSFRVSTVSCTSVSCAASDFSASALTAKAAEVKDVVTLSVVGCVLGLTLGVIVVVVLVLYNRRQRRRPKSKGDGRPEVEEEELSDMLTPRTVTIQDYGDKLREWKSELDDTGFPTVLVEQFDKLRDYNSQHSKTAATLEENKKKNRYTNILPYDHTRVKLLQLDDDVTTDYINANYISGYHGVREYIASQGPLELTVGDFWRMVWEQRCPVIVMLSALSEGRLNKVHQYYPEDDMLNEPVTYGMVTVTLQEVDPHKDYFVRTFRLNVGRGCHEVRQFFVDSWKDFQANLTPHLVLDFVRAVREHVPAENSHPLLVHCSAGVGRTGTWIAIDYFMHYIRHSPLSAPLSIRDFVNTMRDSRVFMVQSLEQYVFLHEVVAELVRRKTEVDRYDEPVYSNPLVYANIAYEQDTDGPNSIAGSSISSSVNSRVPHHHHHPGAPPNPSTTTTTTTDTKNGDKSTLPSPSPLGLPSDVIGVMTSRM